MPLDPQVQTYLQQIADLGIPPRYTLPVDIVRERAREQRKALWAAEQVPVFSSEDRKIPGPQGEIPIRIYVPDARGPFPVLVFFHGGGWLLGDLDTHDGVCRSLAMGAGCVVVAVDYRLAPEHKFPAAVEDCYAATCWIAANGASWQGDPARIAVGGDSSGGNLAAVVALLARDRGGPRLAFQLLIYPVTDARISTPSYEENAVGYGLNKQEMIWFVNHYINSAEDKLNPLVSTLLAPSLEGLPPALVITAEYDPLRDEAELYAQRLQEAGVLTTLTRYHGMNHGFVSLFPLFDRGKQALSECIQALRVVFNA